MTPSGSVHWSASFRTTSGRMNAFQVVTMASTLTVARAGRASGSSTRQKNPNEPQPSIRAASSSSTGMLRKNGRRMTIDSGSPKAACGSATPSRLPDSPSWRIRMYSGRIATAVGNSSPNTNSVYMRLAAAEPDPGEDERRQRRAARP